MASGLYSARMPQDRRRSGKANCPFALAVCVIIAVCANTVVANASERLALTFIKGFPVIDSVFINGTGPYRFLLDTGASTNQIDEKLAMELGLVMSYRVEFVTANGRGYLPGGQVPEISVGDMSVRNAEMIWTSATAGLPLGGISGVIGQEFLSRFNFLLDLEGHLLIFNPLIHGERTPIERVNQMDVVKVPGLGRLVLDTGASSVCMYRAPGVVPGVVAGDLTASYLQTSSGETKVRTGKMKVLRVGGYEFKQVPFVVSPQADVVDGLLPVRLFRAVYFNNAEGYIVLNPDVN